MHGHWIMRSTVSGCASGYVSGCGSECHERLAAAVVPAEVAAASAASVGSVMVAAGAYIVGAVPRSPYAHADNVGSDKRRVVVVVVVDKRWA